MAYEHTLTAAEKRELLRIARASLREWARSGRIPPGRPHRAPLLAPASVHVALRERARPHAETRAESEDTPLYRGVQEAVREAAELAGASGAEGRERGVDIESVLIEIAVLGPRAEVTDLSQIRVGDHGLAVQVGGRRAALLPGAAAEEAHDAAALVSRACERVGADPSAWQSGRARVEIFTVQIAREEGPDAPL